MKILFLSELVVIAQRLLSSRFEDIKFYHFFLGYAQVVHWAQLARILLAQRYLCLSRKSVADDSLSVGLNIGWDQIRQLTVDAFKSHFIIFILDACYDFINVDELSLEVTNLGFEVLNIFQRGLSLRLSLDCAPSHFVLAYFLNDANPLHHIRYVVNSTFLDTEFLCRLL